MIENIPRLVRGLGNDLDHISESKFKDIFDEIRDTCFQIVETEGEEKDVIRKVSEKLDELAILALNPTVLKTIKALRKEILDLL